MINKEEITQLEDDCYMILHFCCKQCAHTASLVRCVCVVARISCFFSLLLSPLNQFVYNRRSKVTRLTMKWRMKCEMETTTAEHGRDRREAAVGRDDDDEKQDLELDRSEIRKP